MAKCFEKLCTCFGYFDLLSLGNCFYNPEEEITHNYPLLLLVFYFWATYIIYVNIYVIDLFGASSSIVDFLGNLLEFVIFRRFAADERNADDRTQRSQSANWKQNRIGCYRKHTIVYRSLCRCRCRCHCRRRSRCCCRWWCFTRDVQRERASVRERERVTELASFTIGLSIPLRTVARTRSCCFLSLFLSSPRHCSPRQALIRNRNLMRRPRSTDLSKVENREFASYQLSTGTAKGISVFSMRMIWMYIMLSKEHYGNG